jgi:diphthine-ammonia ligase
VSPLTAIASWSGGKDSCLACFRAMKSGYKIEYLLNFISRKYNRCCFHGIEASLLNLQAEALGIPLIQVPVTDDMKTYEQEFKQAVLKVKEESSISSMIFGDIYLLDHVNWVERVCNDMGVKAVEPLWNNQPQELMKEFLDLGFKAVIVSAKADVLGEEFVGKTIDPDLVEEFKRRKICPCGENGEFHTFVYDGPMFKRRIEIVKGEPVLKKGFWEHWFLDIKEYRGCPGTVTIRS